MYLPFKSGGLLGTAALLTISTPVSAMENYRCARNGVDFLLEIKDSREDAGPVCETILRTGPDERQTLWRVDDDTDSCRHRTQRFMSVLGSQGWQCKIGAAESLYTERAERPSISVSELATPLAETAPSTFSESSKVRQLPNLVKTNGYDCRRESDRREIWIEVAGPDTPLPCQVLWMADDASNPEVIWQAHNEPGFCATRLPATLDAWSRNGWRCTAQGKSDVGPVAAAPAEANEPLDRSRSDDPEGLVQSFESIPSEDRLPEGATSFQIEALEELDLAATEPPSPVLGFLPKQDQANGPMMRLLDTARWLQPDRFEGNQTESETSNFKWLRGEGDLREKLSQDLETLAERSGLEFTIKNGLFSNIYGGEHPDVVVLITYRDADRKPRFLLNAYRVQEDGHRMADSLIFDANWTGDANESGGYYVLSETSGLN